MLTAAERYRDLVLSTGQLRAFYEMDDSSGTRIREAVNGLHGTIAGTPTMGRDGPAGGAAIQFDGTAVQISLPASTKLDLGDGPFTLECWFKLTGGTGANRKLIFRGGGGGCSMDPRSDNVIHGGVPDTGFYADGTTGITDTARWHFASVVKDALTIRKVYLDGKDDTAAVSAFTATNVGSWFIGSAGGAEFFTGYIARVGIYAAALDLTAHRIRWAVGLGG